MIRAVLCLLLWATPALATQDGWPALYNVSGVGSDDVLNLRAAPDASSELVGSLSHDTVDIEVIQANATDTWGLVNVGERSGWVSLRFMTRQPGQWFGKFPDVQQCFGTEPFWGVNFDQDVFQFTEPGSSSDGHVVERWSSVNRRDSHAMSLRLGDLSDKDTVGMLTLQSCNDGMSDREFGIRFEVLFHGSAEPVLLSGCCSIQPRAR